MYNQAQFEYQQALSRQADANTYFQSTTIPQQQQQQPLLQWTRSPAGDEYTQGKSAQIWPSSAECSGQQKQNGSGVVHEKYAKLSRKRRRHEKQDYSQLLAHLSLADALEYGIESNQQDGQSLAERVSHRSKRPRLATDSTTQQSGYISSAQQLQPKNPFSVNASSPDIDSSMATDCNEWTHQSKSKMIQSQQAQALMKEKMKAQLELFRKQFSLAQRGFSVTDCCDSLPGPARRS